ncbi:MAG: hypothetical protein KDI03_17340, partial [Anaerolineae bacterium]|nr:hypothetical protein [Anaerolineae bacterium]
MNLKKRKEGEKKERRETGEGEEDRSLRCAALLSPDFLPFLLFPLLYASSVEMSPTSLPSACAL